MENHCNLFMFVIWNEKYYFTVNRIRSLRSGRGQSSLYLFDALHVWKIFKNSLFKGLEYKMDNWFNLFMIFIKFYFVKRTADLWKLIGLYHFLLYQSLILTNTTFYFTKLTFLADKIFVALYFNIKAFDLKNRIHSDNFE